MCGIGGVWSTNMVDTEIEMARKLLILNSFRGEDSVGMLDHIPQVKKKQTLYWKRAENPLEFACKTFDFTWGSRWKTNKPLFIAVHARAATKGKVIDKNAHPFCFDNIIGMHNGTISEAFTNSDKFETDSEAIFQNIKLRGLKETLKELSSKTPAYALVWYDTKERTLNFIRNSKRPLYFASFCNNTGFAWSSEKEHLSLGLKTGWSIPASKDVSPFEIYKHYTLPVDAKDCIKEMQVQEIKEAEETISHYGYGANGRNFENFFYGEYALYPKVTTNPLAKEGDNWRKGSSIPLSTEPLQPWETLNYIQDMGSINYNAVRHKYDEISKKYYSDYWYLRLQKRREQVDREANLRLSFAGKEKEESAKGSSKKEVVSELIPFGRSSGHTCSYEGYKKKISKGCFSCGELVEFKDPIVWLDDKDKFICSDCALDVVTDIENHFMIKTGILSDPDVIYINGKIEQLNYGD